MSFRRKAFLVSLIILAAIGAAAVTMHRPGEELRHSDHALLARIEPSASRQHSPPQQLAA